MLKQYDYNDFRSAAGTANSLFPVGALLGWPKTTGGAANQKAISAAATTIDPVTQMLYTWFAADSAAARGKSSNQVIPLSPTSHAVVLAKDTDIYDYEDSSLDYVVPVYWRATFKATGIKQDVTSYGATPWPADGYCTRLSIIPGNR